MAGTPGAPVSRARRAGLLLPCLAGTGRARRARAEGGANGPARLRTSMPGRFVSGVMKLDHNHDWFPLCEKSRAARAPESVRAAQERALLEEGARRFPYFDKLHLMRGQLEERAGRPDAARAAYEAGLRRCLGSAPLWVAAARLEAATGAVGKARARLEQVRGPIPT